MHDDKKNSRKVWLRNFGYINRNRIGHQPSGFYIVYHVVSLIIFKLIKGFRFFL